MIYLLYGQPASGKTSLGNKLKTHFHTPFIIDGDEFREMFTNKNYGKEGREENLRNANAVATYLNKMKISSGDGYFPIIMTLVSPYNHLRDELKRNNEGEVRDVLLTSTRELRKEYHVEDFEKGSPAFELNTDKEVEETWKELKLLLGI